MSKDVLGLTLGVGAVVLGYMVLKGKLKMPSLHLSSSAGDPKMAAAGGQANYGDVTLNIPDLPIESDGTPNFNAIKFPSSQAFLQQMQFKASDFGPNFGMSA